MADRPEFQSPELGTMNVAPRKVRPMYADDHWNSQPWYEAPREDPDIPEVYTYTDAISYDPGDEVTFHSTSTARTWRMQIYRDGLHPETVHEVEAIDGVFAPTPKDAYRNGCNWPVSHQWTLPADLKSGFYRVVSTCERPNGI